MRVQLVCIVAAALLGGASCSRSESPGQPAVDGSSAAAPGSGAGTAVAPPPTARAEGTGAGATEGSAHWADQAVRADLPDLVGAMRAVGFGEASAADLAEFVPVPPGAEGVAGSFAEGTRQVRVAVVLYPNEQYARPHVTDVLERIRVVPSTPEAVRRNATLVLHVRAGDAATAAEVADQLARQLGWPPG